jgi:single-stranded-DNA-specific exonuclease
MRSRAWRPGKNRWELAPAFPLASEWARQLGTSPLVAQALHNRGVGSVDDARRFLAPKLTDLHDPAMLEGCEEAARRILHAVRDKRRIVIYGDYDVDGMTGVAILHGCLALLGCQADFYVPHRTEEGYGVNPAAMRKLARDGAQLVVTVDCGISDGAAIAQASADGVAVIVTDHHALPGDLPPAAAVVHPALGQYPNAALCGAGVAFKLAWAIAREAGAEKQVRPAGQGPADRTARVDEPLREFLVEATCLAALGTIADVSPLIGENRVLAHYGLKGLPATRQPGVRALLESAGLANRKDLCAEDVGFSLAPRLNASGRMGHARQAVELLLCRDDERCRQIASHLEQLNTQRQDVERAIYDEAAEMVRQRGLDAPDSPVIVLSSDRWHDGVIGIVAGRLAERFGRPAVMIAIHADGTAQGSCRGVAGFSIRDGLAACSEHLDAFGGHAMAAGLRIAPAKIDAFAQALARHASGWAARRSARDAHAAAPAGDAFSLPLALDARATIAGLTFAVAQSLERMAPFGQGNPPPLVRIDGCKVLTEPRRMGRSGGTVAFHLGQPAAPPAAGTGASAAAQGASIRAIGFGMAELADRLRVGSVVSVAAEPGVNRFNGAASVELRLRDVAWE